MGLVFLFEECQLARVQLDVQRTDGLIELLQLRRADDRRGAAWLAQQPRERNLRRRDAALLRQLGATVRDLDVGLLVVHLMGESVGLRARRIALRALAPVAGQEAAR